MNTSNIDTDHSPDKYEKFFNIRCEAVAYLWAIGDYGDDAGALQIAVDQLEQARKELGLDADAAQIAMARAFSRLRDDLGSWVVP